MNSNDPYGGPRRHLLREGWFWIVAVLITLALIAGSVLGWRWVTADTKGKVQAREQIKSGASRIQAYDHFYNLCAAVQAQEGALEAQYAELATADASDRARLRTNITGITAQRSRSVAQYNADARKSYTIGQFRASDLPYELPANYVKGEQTSCG